MKKLSPQKMSKMMVLYFQGCTQTEIASKLKIDQSTVSLNVGKMKTLATEKGMEVALEEYGVTDTVQALHNLGAELKKSGMTVEEARNGLKMEKLFQKSGIKQEQYGHVIKACKRMQEEGFIAAAIELGSLEESTGTNYDELLAHYTEVQNELEESTAGLQAATNNLAALKKEVATSEKQKAVAEEDLHNYMKQVGVDMQRLKLVEHLAKALKDAGIPDVEIETCVKRQQALNEASLDVALFATIVQKTKLVTVLDHGKGLLKSLSEYGGLMETCAGLRAEAKVLKAQVAGLEQQATLKGKIEVEVSKLKAEKASLEPHVADLNAQYHALVTLQNEIAVLAPEKIALEQKFGELEMWVAELNDDIETGKKNVADLKELELKRNVLLKEMATIEAKLESDQKRWKVYQGFLGLVQSTSRQELKNAVDTLPALVEELPQNISANKLDFLKNYILKDLTGKKLPVLLICNTCGASIATDIGEPTGGYRCTNGGSVMAVPHQVIVEKNPLAVLKEVLASGAPKKVVNMKPVLITQQPETSAGNT